MLITRFETVIKGKSECSRAHETQDNRIIGLITWRALISNSVSVEGDTPDGIRVSRYRSAFPQILTRLRSPMIYDGVPEKNES